MSQFATESGAAGLVDVVRISPAGFRLKTRYCHAIEVFAVDFILLLIDLFHFEAVAEGKVDWPTQS